MNPNPIPPEQRRVLLVDDHALMRESVAEIVNRAPGLEVCGQADSFEAALRAFAAARPHLVVTDLSLPQRNGFNLIEELCAHAPQVPVLVLSMYSESLHAPKAFRAGAAGYVMKGDGGQLLAGIRRVLAGGIQLSEHTRREIMRQLQAERTQGSQPPFARLTDHERAVFRLRGRRLDPPAIAQALGEESARIRELLGDIRQKLRLANDVALLHHAILWVETGGTAPD